MAQSHVRPDLTEEEANFVLAVLRRFPHQGNTEQLAPIVARTQTIVNKIIAAGQASGQESPTDPDSKVSSGT